MVLSLKIMQMIKTEIHNAPEFAHENALLIDKIIQMASQHDLRLDIQYRPTRQILLKELPKYRQSTPEELDKHAITIYQKINDAHHPQPNLYASRGTFNSEYIHQRRERDWLQDHDMNFLMPHSTAHISVVASLDTGTQNSQAFSEGIKLQLSNPDIQHIMFPIGPSHWRGGYLSKPSESNPCFTLEIFDSFGANSAKSVLNFVLNALKMCGIDASNLNVKFSSPAVLQRDGYSCGDFVCAHSHQKMLDFNAPSSAVNLELVNALAQGNTQHQLRKTICTQFEPTPIVPRSSHQQHVQDILSIKDTLFKNAQMIEEKQKKNMPITDEECATLLQVEEINKLTRK